MEAHEFSNLFPMMSSAELSLLCDDMRSRGYDATVPIILYNGKILDGRNRQLAADTVGIVPPYVEFTGDNPLAFVIGHNLHRRHLNETQRAGVAAKIANMQAGGDRPSTKDSTFDSANLQSRNISIPQAADMLNVGSRTVATYRAVAAAMPELVEKMDRGEMSANSAFTEMKRAAVRRNLDDISVQKAKAATGVYDVIVIDPPWPMEKIERDVAPGQVAFEYPTMTLGDISKVSLPASDDCHVFLWTTQKFLPMAFELLKSWDLKYVLTFVWHKNGGFQPFNLPQYNCEFVLYARKGTPSFVDFKNFMTCFNAPRKVHSEKPEEFYDLLRRVTKGRRLDMYNRRAIDGFDGRGKESK